LNVSHRVRMWPSCLSHLVGVYNPNVFSPPFHCRVLHIAFSTCMCPSSPSPRSNATVSSQSFSLVKHHRASPHTFFSSPSPSFPTGALLAKTAIIPATFPAFSRLASSSAGSDNVSNPPNSHSSCRSRISVLRSRVVLICIEHQLCIPPSLPLR
jgi:hypothetical protein